MSPTSQRILHIAIPSIISNITVPLLGLIDVTIVGHLGSASYIGAIAVGGMLFNMIYWIFGFLRMGTSGLTAQAYGAHDLKEVTRILLRSTGISLMLALALLILRNYTIPVWQVLPRYRYGNTAWQVVVPRRLCRSVQKLSDVSDIAG